jgi:putative NADH-flavin reductase
MRVAIVGATGQVGSRLLQEALRRGHAVIAIVRNPSKLPQHPLLRGTATDVFDTAALTAAIRGTQAVLQAYRPPREDPLEARIDGQRRATRSIVAAAKSAAVARVLAVGGAGTLEVAPGVLNMDRPEFPAAWKGGAASTAQVKEVLQAQREVQWTVLCPAHNLVAGERTGQFRLGTDQLLVDASGDSRISFEDFAVALLDELEHPRHTGRRFTVGY